MWLKPLIQPLDILWDAPFELDLGEGGNATMRDGGQSGDIRDLPIVSIGKPFAWNLLDFKPNDNISPFVQSLLERANYHLIRFVCSFRTNNESAQIDWARFIVKFLEDDLGNQSIVYDMHPLIVNHEVRRNTKVTISPEIKFEEIGLGIGGADFGFEYSELYPLIAASGIGETEVNWDYESAKGAGIVGSKLMYLLLRVPKGMRSVNAQLDVLADVKVQKKIFKVVLTRNKQEVSQRLTIPII